jgi:hypothetical protein
MVIPSRGLGERAQLAVNTGETSGAGLSEIAALLDGGTSQVKRDTGGGNGRCHADESESDTELHRSLEQARE